MRRPLLVLGLLAVVAVVAVASCFFSLRFMRDRAPMNHADAHKWFHTQLGLTAHQEKQLAPIEQRYDEQKRNLGELIRLANMELAQALLSDKGESPRVKATVLKIHESQGHLQDATLRHVFEMKPVLTPEQYEKLLNLTANALYQVDHAQ